MLDQCFEGCGGLFTVQQSVNEETIPLSNHLLKRQPTELPARFRDVVVFTFSRHNPSGEAYDPVDTLAHRYLGGSPGR